MTYLSAAVVIIGVLCMLNLVITLGLVRRLRSQSGPAGQDGHPAHIGGRRPWHLPLGSPAPDFAATTVTDETISRADLIGRPSVIAFFSVVCPPCRMQLPELRKYAESFGEGAVLAIVSGPREKAEEFVRELDGVAPVVVEPMQGPTALAFTVSNFPTLYRLDADGRIAASAITVGAIAEADKEPV